MTMERLFSGLLAMVSLGCIYLAWGYVAPIAYDPIGPRPYPLLIFSLLALGSLIITFRPKKFTKRIELDFNSAIVKNLILCVIVFLLYGLLFELLGFVISTTLMVLAIGLLFSGNWTRTLIFSILVSIGLYILFDVFLDVKLPLGLLNNF